MVLRHVGLLCALAVLAAVPAADALADQEIDELLELSVDELLDMSVETGSFLAVDYRESPFSLTVIDEEEIELSGARHLGELLEIFVPGFQYMYNKWNGDIWGMRGIAVDRNTKIIFLINGIKQNHESRDGAYSEINLGLLGDIERVEVLRGPAGLAYGSGAIAGVVNVVTKQPERAGGEASVRYGSFDSYGAEALAHGKLENGGGITVAAGYRRSDGINARETRVYGDNSWPSDYAVSPNGEPTDGPFGYTPGNVRLSVDLDFDELRIYSRYTRQRFGTGGLFIVDPFPEIAGQPGADAAPREVDGRLITASDPLANTESWGSSRRHHLVENITAGADYDIDLGDDIIKLAAAFTGATNRTQTEFREGYQVPGVSPQAGAVSETFGERRYLLEAQYQLNRYDDFQSAVGAEYRWDDIGDDLDGQNYANSNSLIPAVGDVDYRTFALFTENRLDIDTAAGDLGVVAGVRYDKHTRTDGELSPKLALIYTPHEHHTIKAIVQTATNNGSADNYEYNRNHYSADGRILSEARLSDPSNPDSQRLPALSEADLRSLDPEEITSYELISIHELGEGWTLIPSVSYNEVQNLFVWNQTLQRVVNGEDFRFITAEAELGYRGPRLSLGLSHAFQRPVDTSRRRTVLTIPATEAVEDPASPGQYTLRETGGTETIELDSIGDQITLDGDDFLNLATHVTKLQATYRPAGVDGLEGFAVHTNVRVFWGLAGRDDIFEADEANGESYLAAGSSPIVKWNAALHYDLPEDMRVSLFAYNLLGEDDSRHALRWQQHALPEQKELFTVDQRALALEVEKRF